MNGCCKEKISQVDKRMRDIQVLVRQTEENVLNLCDFSG